MLTQAQRRNETKREKNSRKADKLYI